MLSTAEVVYYMQLSLKHSDHIQGLSVGVLQTCAFNSGCIQPLFILLGVEPTSSWVCNVVRTFPNYKQTFQVSFQNQAEIDQYFRHLT